jgi:hypothetical protein
MDPEPFSGIAETRFLSGGAAIPTASTPLPRSLPLRVRL